jgi:hypothetical protein
MTNLEIILTVILAIITGFCFGLVVGLNSSDYDDENMYEELYCFQCEIEMPVKEKKGRLSCANCGLSHKPK